MKRKVLYALLIAVLVLGGCGKKDKEDKKTDTKAQTPAQEESADAESADAESAQEETVDAENADAEPVDAENADAEPAQEAQAAESQQTEEQSGDSAGSEEYQLDTTITRDSITKYLSDESGKTLLETGMEYLKNGESEKAYEILTVAAREDKKCDLEKAYRGIGICLMGRDKYEDAIKAFNTALSHAGADAKALEYDICYYKASCLVRLNRLNDALDLYNLLVDYKPDGKTYIGRGAVYSKLGNTELAQEDFNKGIEEDSKNYDLYIEVYELLNVAGRDDLGQEYLKKALEIEKDSSKNNLEKGKIYYYMGSYDLAKTELEKLKSEDNPDVLLYLGRTYEALGDPNYAATLYEQYLEMDSSDGSIYNMIGLLRISQEDYQGALDIIQKGLENAITSKQNLYRNEIVAYEYLQDYTTAKEKLTEYIANYPEDSEAQREMIFLNSRTHNS